MNKHKIRTRQRARKLTVQALYQWILSGHSAIEIEQQFIAFNNMLKVDAQYFHDLLYGVMQNVITIETVFSSFIDRPTSNLDPIELTLLRLGTYELIYHTEIPYRIILDEAISLSKEFGSEDGYKYVNGVLNKVARHIRAQELI